MTRGNQTIKKAITPVLVPLILTIVIDSLGVGLVYPVFASIFNTSPTGVLAPGTSVALGNFLYGLTLAAFPVGMFIGAPILGDLSDHWGRKKVLLLSLYAGGLGMWFCGAAVSHRIISLIILSRFFTGLLAGNIGIAQAAIIDISPASKKTVNLSFISIAIGVGFAIGPIVGSYFVISPFFGQFGYAGPFVVAGIFALFNATLLWVVFTETSKLFKSSKIELHKGYKLFISGFKTKKLRLLAILLFLIQIAWGLYFLASSILMVETFNFSISRLGYFISLLATVYGLALIIIMRIMLKMLDIKRILFWSSLILGIGMVTASIKLEIASWISIFPVATGSGLCYLCIITLFSDSVAKDSQGWAMGVAASIMAVAACFSSIFTGLLSSQFFPLSYLTAAVLTFIASLIVKAKL